MPRNFLPGSDAGLLAWSANFAAQVAPDPGAVGLTAAQAGAYAQTQAAFAAALTTATEPETAGPSKTLAKNERRAALVAASRELARVVRSRPGVSDQQMYDLGLTIRPRRYGRSARPAFAPGLRVRATGDGRLAFALWDRAHRARQGRPADAAGAVVFWCAGAQPAALGGGTRWVGSKARLPGAAWHYAGMRPGVRWVTGYPQGVAPGTVIWFTACWQNARGEPGPYAEPAKLIVGFDARPTLDHGLRWTAQATGQPEPTQQKLAA